MVKKILLETNFPCWLFLDHIWTFWVGQCLRDRAFPMQSTHRVSRQKKRGREHVGNTMGTKKIPTFRPNGQNIFISYSHRVHNIMGQTFWPSGKNLATSRHVCEIINWFIFHFSLYKNRIFLNIFRQTKFLWFFFSRKFQHFWK